jgi:serine phosphatase RsbU (regulator of sigma subunit)
MIIFKRFILSFLLFIPVVQIIGQTGSPYITNYQLSDFIDKENWAIIQDNDNVMLFANRKGILLFDSHDWDLARTPDIPYTMVKDDKSGKIYVGCNNNFGYLLKNDAGKYFYHSLSSKYKNIGEINQIVVTSDYVYFCSETTLTRVSKSNIDLQKQWKSNEFNPFKGIISFNNELYVNIYEYGLHTIVNDAFQLIKGTDDLAYLDVLFSFPANSKNILIGASNNRLFSFNGKNTSQFKIKDQEFLNESSLLSGIDIDGSKFALSTLTGGSVVIDKTTGITLYTINYRSGLPDDEILAMGKDNNNGLWLAHQYGISRVDFDFPAKNFNTYPGLEGNLISFIDYNNTLYVSTSKGVFYLDQQKKSNNTEGTGSNEGEKQKSGRNGFARHKSRTGDDGNSGMNDNKEMKSKRIYDLISLDHKFSKVTGIDEKCRQFLKMPGKLLVVGTTGIFEIDGSSSKKIAHSNEINCAAVSPSKHRIFIGTTKGLFSAVFNGSNWIEEEGFNYFKENVHSICIIDRKNVWAGCENKAFRLELDPSDSPLKARRYNFKSDFSEKIIVRSVKGVPYFFLTSGVYSYKKEKDTIGNVYKTDLDLNSIPRYIYSDDGSTWKNYKGQWVNFNDTVNSGLHAKFLNVYDDIQNIFTDSKNNLWVLNGNALIRISPSSQNQYQPDFDVYVKGASDNSGLIFNLKGTSMKYGDNPFEFHIVAPYFLKSNSTQYQYYVKGVKDSWSKWSVNTTIEFPYLHSGNYVLHVRAKNILGKISEEKILEFRIEAPFTQTWWFYGLCLLLFLLLVIGIIKFREKKLQYDKKILEGKVKERTIEIECQRDELAAQNEEILQQKEELEAQRDEIEGQRDQIIYQNKEITDSIYYAQRIQNAIMPSYEVFESIIPEHFILFQPRDIVSGDFYWGYRSNNILTIAVADCTGHGVPGAFMSMLGISFLNQIVGKNSTHKANEVLNELRKLLKKTIARSGPENVAKDGMNIALCVFDFDTNQLQFAGAYHSLLMVRNGLLSEIKSDKMPIGPHPLENESFINHEISFQKNDSFYMFSDGYIDQFGGEKESRFRSKPFKQLISNIQEFSMLEQGVKLKQTLDEWQGPIEQLDDILVMGLKIT